MTDRKADAPKSTTPIIRIFKRENLLYPDERPTKLCEELEELRAWMDRSARSDILLNTYNPQATAYAA